MHIGLAQPGSPGATPRPQPVRKPADDTPLQERSLLVGDGIGWAKHGVQPRWLGQESGECAVALEPGIYHNTGHEEYKRFLAGAAGRGETALLISSISDVNAPRRSNVFASWDASVLMPLDGASIGGRRLPEGALPKLADDLDAVEHDLAVRLPNRPPSAWWTLEVRANQMSSGGGVPLPTGVPAGELRPILVDTLGTPVVAVWIPGEGNQRWYIIPDSADWNTVIAWLVDKALPTHNPDALRRARHSGFIDPDLQSTDETRAREALQDLETDYTQRKTQLEEQLHTAQQLAEPLRNGLLYGTGRELQDAVTTVLTAAGLTVTDLDSELGTESADLLVSAGTRRILVEVKSAGGPAAEKLVDYLRKHIETWPRLKPDLPVTGGTLIVNHQHKLPPHERAEKVYDRKAFLETLPYPVVPSRELFDFWRAQDWTAMRSAVLGPENRTASEPASDPAETRGTPERRGSVWRRALRKTG
jgi:hypothetical protein